VSLPEVAKIRSCIEQVEREEIRLALMAEYLWAARIREVVGKVAATDTYPNLIYGPIGTDVTLKKYKPKVPETFKAIQVIYPEAKAQIEEMFQPVDVAVFTVNIAKRHLEEEEKIHSRLIALPIDSEYEPWTQELLAYFKDAGSDYVFPFTRQEVWYWITHKEPVFKGLTYPIEKYVWKPKNKDVILKVLPHDKPFKNHALRHLRITELRRDYLFDGLQLAAYAGWSMTHASTQTRTHESYSQQTTTYFPLYREWQAYFPKLLVKRI